MYIAIDIGGTKIALAKVDKLDTPTIVNKQTISTPQNYEEGLEKIFIQIQTMSKWQKIEGIGITVPGSVQHNKVELLTNLPDWSRRPFHEDFEKKFSTKINIRNDAVATARAERYFGKAKGLSRYLYVIIGTGFGGTYVHKVGDSFLELPLEPEYMIINKEGSGRNRFHTKGLLGAYATGASIQEKMGLHSLASLDDNDPIWGEMSNYLGIGLNNLITLFKPPVIIFSGGIIMHRQFMLKSLRMELAKYIEYLPQPELLLTDFKEDASLYGAISLLYELQ